MPVWLRGVARFNPLTYLVDAIRSLMVEAGGSAYGLAVDWSVMLAILVLLTALGGSGRSKPSMKGHFKTGSHLGEYSRVACPPKGGTAVHGELKEYGCKGFDTNAFSVEVDEEPDCAGAGDPSRDGGALHSVGGRVERGS